MIQAVIFDLDGVIVSTDQLHYQAWKTMCDKEEIYFNEEINHQLRGISRMASLDIILQKATKQYTDQEKLDLASFKNDIYRESLDQLTPNDILPNVLDVLSSLKDAGIKIAIGSSSKNAKKILKQIDLFNLFDAISDGTNISRSKPDPEVFEKAADMMGIPYENCAVVEDAVAGIEAAKACNMLAFAVGDAERSIMKDFYFEQLLEQVLK